MNFQKVLFSLICGFVINSTPLFSFANISHTEGNWIDNRDGYTSFEVFVDQALKQNDSFVSFLDFKGHFFNHGRVAVNSGLAFRYARDDSKIFGGNLFYDYRQATSEHNFHQIGLGVEYLTDAFDFRLNGYIPISKSLLRTNSITFNYPGGYKATAADLRASYGGFDAEVGSFIKNPNWDETRLYAAFGYYYYARTHKFSNDYGIKARIETKFSDYFTFEFKGGFDHVNHGMAQGTLYASIPLESLFNFCFKQKIECPKNNRLYQPIKRQDIIALTEKSCGWIWNWDSPTVPCCN